jgi:hypothetical protein
MRLHLFIEEKRRTPFNWKDNNCAFFACDWLAILTGKDPAADYRAKVDSALSAARALGETTVEQIAEQVCAENEWAEVPPSLARRGDIMLMDAQNGPALGVCEGGRAVFASPDGVALVKTSACRRAWRVG